MDVRFSHASDAVMISLVNVSSQGSPANQLLYRDMTTLRHRYAHCEENVGHKLQVGLDGHAHK